MDDIAPILLEEIQKKYQNGVRKNKILRDIQILIESGKITYEDAQKAAQEIGEILSGAYQDVFSVDVLPDGKMYYNIATRTVGTTMEQAYADVVGIAEDTQKALNQSAGLGLKAVLSLIHISVVNALHAEYLGSLEKGKK